VSITVWRDAASPLSYLDRLDACIVKVAAREIKRPIRPSISLLPAWIFRSCCWLF
jgi:hypothetical protein